MMKLLSFNNVVRQEAHVQLFKKFLITQLGPTDLILGALQKCCLCPALDLLQLSTKLVL